MQDFEFYPHTVQIYRGGTLDPVTGKEIETLVYEGPCYLNKGQTWFRGTRYSVENTVKLDNMQVQVMKGDTVIVTLENGTTYKATVKQAYPVKDDDFGGQDLEVYQ